MTYWPHSNPQDPASWDVPANHTQCALCPRQLRDDETMTCRRCIERLDEILDEIVEFYALLPSVLLPGSVSDDMPHGKQVDAPAPVRLDVLDALDTRAVGDEFRGTLGIVGGWARMVREERQLSDESEPTVVGEVALLRKHLEWVGQQPWVDEFATEIKSLHRDLRQTVGESAPKSIGACPAERIVDGIPTICGASLFAPVHGDTVRCRRCKTTWPRDRWKILGAVILEGEGA